MFETLISLFERLVIAHEKLAASQEAILRVTDVRVVEDPAPATEPEKPKTTRAKKEKAQEPVEAPKAEAPKKEEPAKPKLTLVDVKAAVAGYAEARMKGGSADPKGDARALMAHHGGGAKKTDEIAEEYWEGVVEACKSGWEPLPAKDEEL
jgi:hypothetical protein